MASGALWQYGAKVAITAIVVVAIAELGKRSSWLVIPSLPLFLLLPLMLKLQWSFWLSLPIACGITAACYAAVAWALPRIGVPL